VRWIALFIVLPAAELALLIEIGSRIGTAATLVLIGVTGVAGALLARRQGLRVAAEVQREVALGHLPADSLLEGLLILVAAALLVTPGVLTDVVGFLCLVPALRERIVREIAGRLERAIRAQRMQIHFVGGTDPFFEASDWDEVDVTSIGRHRRDGPTVH